MKFVISTALWIVLGGAGAVTNDYRAETLREIALSHADYSPQSLNLPFDSDKSELGKLFFEDESLAYGGEISCRTCHLDEFSSADGLPVAIGVGARGKGLERLVSGGEILTRNTLPLWGRGGRGFNTFFWDGKVQIVGNSVISQFGKIGGAEFALRTAIHLPFVELDEMIAENGNVVSLFKNENVESANLLFEAIAKNVRSNPTYLAKIKNTYSLEEDEISFEIVADAIDNFIRDVFALQQTKFSRFLDRSDTLLPEEISGGLIFYGKGKCVGCHSGPYFSDFDFHTIATVQVGYGKNGFGVDYGRFNVSHSYDDLYSFRTPPLYNVADTSPFMHSGSIGGLDEAIRAHFDPLGVVGIDQMSSADRVEFYRKIKSASQNSTQIPFLSDSDVDELVMFLESLSFSDNR